MHQIVGNFNAISGSKLHFNANDSLGDITKYASSTCQRMLRFIIFLSQEINNTQIPTKDVSNCAEHLCDIRGQETCKSLIKY